VTEEQERQMAANPTRDIESLNLETEYIGQLFALINGNFAQIMFLAGYYYLL
jgi:hypothetical protein